MTPLVTIGLPFYNEAPHLAAAIRSMLLQTFRDFELVLVDDGSTDDSLAVARGFHDARIRVVADGRRRHLPARLNEIVHVARGKFVARMDADDFSHPERIAQTMGGLVDHDVVGALAALSPEDGVVTGVVGSGPLPRTRAEVLKRGGLLVHPTVIARRDWFLANPYDETLTRAEDFELWCRTVEGLRFRVIELPLHIKRTRARDARFVEQYSLSHRQNRSTFVKYGPRAGGLVQTARMWLTSQAKVLVMRAALSHGLQRFVTRAAGRPVAPEEWPLIRETLALMAQTP